MNHYRCHANSTALPGPNAKASLRRPSGYSSASGRKTALRIALVRNCQKLTASPRRPGGRPRCGCGNPAPRSLVLRLRETLPRPSTGGWGNVGGCRGERNGERHRSSAATPRETRTLEGGHRRTRLGLRFAARGKTKRAAGRLPPSESEQGCTRPGAKRPRWQETPSRAWHFGPGSG